MARAPVALLFLVACAGPEPVDEGLPDGLLVLARPSAVGRLARCLDAFSPSPAASALAAWVAGAAGCDRLFSGDGCVADSPLSSRLGDADVAFALPTPVGRVVGTATVGSTGDVHAIAWSDRPAQPGAWGLLLPGEAPAGPGILSDATALLHARARPSGGIDVASLVPEQGQAADMFQLKSRLFGGAVLDGTWEFAVYPPPEGRTFPRLALGLGVRTQQGGVAAMEGFIDALARQWDVHRAPLTVGGSTGSCLPDLKVLPGFQPCYVATSSALVAGWDARSVEEALAPAGDEAPASLVAVAHLDRFAGTDASIAAAMDAAPVARSYPWGELRIEGQEEQGRIRWDLSSRSGCGP